MLEAMGQFGQYYRGQAQGTLGSLVATPSVKIDFSIWSRE